MAFRRTKSAQSDEALLAESVKHPAQFAELVDRYQKPFLRRAADVMHSREDAEDVVQDAFVKIYTHADRLTDNDAGAFRRWAYTILINTALSHYRKKYNANAPERMPQEMSARFADEKTSTFADELANRQHIEAVLSRMQPGFRSVLTQHYIDGYSQEEIARAEHTTTSAIKARVHRAKRSFRAISRTLNGGYEP